MKYSLFIRKDIFLLVLSFLRDGYLQLNQYGLDRWTTTCSSNRIVQLTLLLPGIRIINKQYVNHNFSFGGLWSLYNKQMLTLKK